MSWTKEIRQTVYQVQEFKGADPRVFTKEELEKQQIMDAVWQLRGGDSLVITRREMTEKELSRL